MNRRWREWFRNQVESWREEGIVSADQAERILDRYEQDFGPASLFRKNRLIAIVGILGAILIGLGIILFFAANWQGIGPSLKVAMIVGGVVVFYGLGYALRFEDGDYPKTGSTFLFLGHLAFGSAIWLIAQIFHLSSHYPNGFLYWLLGTLAMSLVLELTSGLALFAILLGSWISAEISYVGYYSVSAISFTDALLALPVWLFPVLAYVAYRAIKTHRSKLSLFFLLGSWVLWVWLVTMRMISVTWHEEVSGPMVLVFVALSGVIYWWGESRMLAGEWPESDTVYKWIGWLILFPILYCLTFEFSAERYLDEALTLSGPVLGELGVLLALGGGLVYRLYRRADQRRRIHLGVEGIFLALVLVVVAFGTVVEAGFVAPFVVAVNVLVLGLSLGYVAKGYVTEHPSWLVAGLTAFFLLVVSRYFDMAWELLPRSLFFVGSGVVLLVVSFVFEFTRRRLMDRMEEGT